jgi:dTDP-4-dehydrorhamnose 3,5-epimerase
MKFTATSIAGVWLVEMERIEDARGWFARSWCEREFAERGLNPRLAQCSVSSNKQKGTLRGMHYQIAPHEEAKLVRCVRGAMFDVALDVRPSSATFKQWFGVELTSENGRMLYVPEGCAHGFQTLADDTEVLYQISTEWRPDSGRGIRWNDPSFGIPWPLPAPSLSPRDAAYADFASSGAGMPAAGENFIAPPPGLSST